MDGNHQRYKILARRKTHFFKVLINQLKKNTAAILLMRNVITNTVSSTVNITGRIGLKLECARGEGVKIYTCNILVRKNGLNTALNSDRVKN